jgi:hypothetical protein
MRRRGFEMLARFVPPSGSTLGRASLALGGELFIQTFEHGVGAVIGTQAQNPASGVFDHATRLEHDFLHHRLHAPPALGRMAHCRLDASA